MVMWKMKEKDFSIFMIILTFLSLLSLLVTVYIQQQAYKFIESNLSIQDSLYITSSTVTVPSSSSSSSSSSSQQQQQFQQITTIPHIWIWIDQLIENFALKTMDDINSNCYYLTNKQNVIIDGITYQLYDPRLSIQSCFQNILHIRENGLKRKVYMNGNNQILSFGMFMKRSYPKKSVRGSSGNIPITISTDETYETPNARYDPKFIETCFIESKPTSMASSSYQCVLNDGFHDEPGTTLGWKGEEYQQYMTFVNTSFSYLYLKGKTSTLLPCYTLSSSRELLAINLSENGTISWIPIETSQPFTNCTLIWLTSGSIIRSKCLSVMNHQYSSRDSFMGAILGGLTVTSVYDHHFDCTRLLKYSLSQVRQWYYQSEDTIRVHITLPNQQRYYGNFFSSSDEFIWLGEGISLSRLLQFHDYLDKNTRQFNIVIVLRNLGDYELFYSLITISFKISTTGYMTKSYSSIFIPIIQYDYGLDNYPWLFKDVAISEFFLAFVLLLLVVKTSYQIYLAFRDGVIPRIRQILRNSSSKPKSDQPSTPTWRAQLNDIWKYFSSGRIYMSPDKSLPTYDSIDISPSSHTTTTVIEQQPQQTILNEIEMNHRPFSSLFTEIHDDENHHEDMKKDNLTIEVNFSDIENSPKKSSSSPNLRNPLRSESFSTPKKSTIPLQRRKSILVEIAGESFKQVKLIVFITWELFLDICAIIILILMLLYRLQFIYSSKRFHQYITNLHDNEIDTSNVVEKIISDFSYLNIYLNNLKIISLVAVLIGISHFFMKTSQGKRLGIVTRTITKTLHDLIPLLFIFMTLLIAYAALGTEIYGAQLIQWSSLYQSMSTLFIMILGNYDTYDEMMQVDSNQTIVFFWSYVAIIYFVVFNIALAVILEVYSDIRKKNQDYFRIKKQESQTRFQEIGDEEEEEKEKEDKEEEDGRLKRKKN